MGGSASAPARGGTGYRIMGVDPDGPCARALSFPDAASARLGRAQRELREGALVPWLDFVVSVNGRDLSGPDGDDVLEEELGAAAGAAGPAGGAAAAAGEEEGEEEDTPVILELWNVKRRAQRTVQVVLPRGSRLGLQVQRAAIPPGGLEAGSFGAGSGVEAADGSAGAEAVLHVTGVEAGSPAASVGLVADDDYLLASLHGGAYEDVDTFGDDVGDALVKCEAAGAVAGPPGAPAPAVLLPVFVYRASTDSVRVVQLPVRATGWGPGGSRRGLGIELACGKFHELPAASFRTDGRAEFEVTAAAAAAIASAAAPVAGQLVAAGGASPRRAATGGEAAAPPVLDMSRFLAHEAPAPAVGSAPIVGAHEATALSAAAPAAAATTTAAAAAAAAAATTAAAAATAPEAAAPAEFAAAESAAAPAHVPAHVPDGSQQHFRVAPPPSLTPFGSANPPPARSLAGPAVQLRQMHMLGQTVVTPLTKL